MKNFMKFWKKYGMFALLLFLALVFTIAEPSNFFSGITFYNILKQASILGVLSCGAALLLIMGELDISHRYTGSAADFLAQPLQHINQKN